MNNSIKNLVIFISLKDSLEYLKTLLDGKEEEIYYTSVLGNIITSVLDNEELSGSRGEAFDDAVGIVTGWFGGDSSKAYEVCTSVLDHVISYITVHIPDYDHPKYTDTLTYEIMDNLDVKITIDAKIIT